MKITVISKPNCVYCTKAKALLDSKGLEYEEKVIGTDITLEEVVQKISFTGIRTVPLIWFDDEFVGTYEMLVKRLG